MKNSRLISGTPVFFTWLKSIFGTLAGLTLILSQTLADGAVLFNIAFLTETNLVMISLICGAIAGTSQLAKKDKPIEYKSK